MSKPPARGTEEVCIDGDEHTPDPQTVAQAQGVFWVVDVRCSKCGRLGSVPVQPADIQW